MEFNNMEEIKKEESILCDDCCERCGDIHAEYVENPFQYEMNNIEVMEWLCADCYSDIAGDI